MGDIRKGQPLSRSVRTLRYASTLMSYVVPMGYILTYPSQAELPSLPFLRERVKVLQEHFPMLWAVVRGQRTTRPWLAGREQGIWSGEDLVRADVLDRILGDTTVEVHQDEAIRTLTQEIKRVGTEDPILRPLWQITLFHGNDTSPSDSPAQGHNQSSGPAYLTLSIDHVLTDGLGALRLLQLLLCPTLPSDLPLETLATVPLLEDSININPSWSHLLPIAFRELILPKIPLPAFVREWFKPVETWPGENMYRGPLDVEPSAWDQVGLKLDAGTVKGLRKRTKEALGEGGTLHPVLLMAWTIAIWAEHKSFGSSEVSLGDADLGHDGNSVDKEKSSHNLFYFEAGTPKGERDSKLGHGVCTGNYTSAHTYHGSIRSETGFWSLVRDLGEELKSPAGIRRTRGGMGLLKFVPDGQIEEVDAEESAEGQEGLLADGLASKTPTKWEEFFLAKAGSSKPIAQAVSLSNLGYTSLRALPGAVDLSWSLPANAFGPALSVTAAGHEGGLNFVAAWLSDIVFTKAEVIRVKDWFGRLLQRVADGVNVAVTVGNLVEGSKEAK